MKDFLGTLEPYPWGWEYTGRLGGYLMNADQTTPTHQSYAFREPDGSLLVVPHPSLVDTVGQEEAERVITQAKLYRTELDAVPVRDVLHRDTDKVIDFILSLDGNPEITDVQKGYVLLARFETVRIKDVHHLLDMQFLYESTKLEEVVPDGNFIGEPKERVSLNVTVTRIVGPYSGEFGDSYLCIMEVEGTGDSVIWWTGENLAFEEGDSYAIKGTVKKHDIHNGRKQTHLQRVKGEKRDKAVSEV